jgi:hypothetical protein
MISQGHGRRAFHDVSDVSFESFNLNMQRSYVSNGQEYETGFEMHFVGSVHNGVVLFVFVEIGQDSFVYVEVQGPRARVLLFDDEAARRHR